MTRSAIGEAIVIEYGVIPTCGYVTVAARVAIVVCRLIGDVARFAIVDDAVVGKYDIIPGGGRVTKAAAIAATVVLIGPVFSMARKAISFQVIMAEYDIVPGSCGMAVAACFTVASVVRGLNADVARGAIVQPVVTEVGNVPGTGPVTGGAVARPVIVRRVWFVAGHTIFRKIPVGELFDLPGVGFVAVSAFAGPQMFVWHIIKVAQTAVYKVAVINGTLNDPAFGCVAIGANSVFVFFGSIIAMARDTICQAVVVFAN